MTCRWAGNVRSGGRALRRETDGEIHQALCQVLAVVRATVRTDPERQMCPVHRDTLQAQPGVEILGGRSETGQQEYLEYVESSCTDIRPQSLVGRMTGESTV